MSDRDAKIRQSQIITTYGPGALLDLPKASAIMGGLDGWPRTDFLKEVIEARLTANLRFLLGDREPRLYEPPAGSDWPPGKNLSAVTAYSFPQWLIVQDEGVGDESSEQRKLSRRLVHRGSLRNGRFEGKPVVATRFVRACTKGHVDDLDWYAFVHEGPSNCRRQLWLDESGTTGDLGDLVVRCECGKKRRMSDASESGKLGSCSGARPWLGTDKTEPCNMKARLLIRTATNAYFPQVMSVLSLPDPTVTLDEIVGRLWSQLELVEDADELRFVKKKPDLSQELRGYADDKVLQAINAHRKNQAKSGPVKVAELAAIRSCPEGHGEDIPINENFHARKLPESIWRKSNLLDPIEAVIQLHRLREVVALIGFTRLEPAVPDVNGEYDVDVERAPLSESPSWFPAVENRGEGLFLLFRSEAVHTWLGGEDVKQRLEQLQEGHRRWAELRKVNPPFPGGPYLMLHTFSHLLLTSLSLSCGYPATAIRERIYVDPETSSYGVLLLTASPDADGTLGGLVAQGQNVEVHVRRALQASSLCSADPICAGHKPGQSRDGRFLHGASCHGCTYIAETSCEMRNEYLDRALVAQVIGSPKTSIFRGIP